MTRTGHGLVVLLSGTIPAERVMSFTRQDSPQASLASLMEAICANPLWEEMPEAHLVGRVEPDVMLGVFGNFTDFQLARLEDLAIHLREGLTRHRYVDYVDAERAVERLAEKLKAELGPECIAKAYFSAIPRGGWVILGMLSYYLELCPRQLVGIDSPPCSPDDLLIIVDDCALSGVRFQQTLQRLEHESVIFCPLFSVPALCRNIEARESRVVSCLSAEDLEDIGPARYGDDYPTWRDRRKQLLGGHGYWVGITEYLAFAWCEPQTRYWDERIQGFSAGWNILPPDLSIKRRVAAQAMNMMRSRWSILEHSGTGPLLPSQRLLWLDNGDEVVLARLPLGADSSIPVFSLAGVAADMWRHLMGSGSLEATHEALLARYRVDADSLLEDLKAFLTQLVDHQVILVRDPP
ncbi:PqqD family peptide modification chaperone [Halomonas sp. ML-15]|uniref:PqqD family protein n=1 Tax=Halomonas sp. ML-15 TaxID=2773305 RepID=UPI0017467F9A|nr:PqqD family protein [Halomonas sp. ML-15]MBD3896167.1 PqqD family peptide modification chaperone [Halomonas sp. ML-15]